MKLGISYQVFDGEEFLEFVTRQIKPLLHHVTVVYQTTSYFGNPAHEGLVPAVEAAYRAGLVDEIVLYEPDLALGPKENELRVRNLGLQKSRDAGCTHHISADVDEFYVPGQLEYAMRVMDDERYDSSIARMISYYKKPTYMLVPHQDQPVSLIHPVDAKYDMAADFPSKIEVTRRHTPSVSCKWFTKDELAIHHMSYVRRDMRRKYANNSNGLYFKIEKFMAVYDTYELGKRVTTIPDFLNRKTVEVANQFNINL